MEGGVPSLQLRAGSGSQPLQAGEQLHNLPISKRRAGVLHRRTRAALPRGRCLLQQHRLLQTGAAGAPHVPSRHPVSDRKWCTSSRGSNLRGGQSGGFVRTAVRNQGGWGANMNTMGGLAVRCGPFMRREVVDTRSSW